MTDNDIDNDIENPIWVTHVCPTHDGAEVRWLVEFPPSVSVDFGGSQRRPILSTWLKEVRVPSCLEPSHQETVYVSEYPETFELDSATANQRVFEEILNGHPPRVSHHYDECVCFRCCRCFEVAVCSCADRQEPITL